MIDTRCILAETSLSLHNGGHVSICNGSRQMFSNDEGTTLTLDKHSLNEAWTSPTRLEIKTALSNNIPHDNCVDCWIKEAAGFPSMRQIHNENLREILPIKTQPRVLILKPGNVCNLGCRHCDSKVSTGWYRDDYAVNFSNLNYNQYLEKFKITKNSYIDSNINWKIIKDWSKQIMHWDLYGAEPLLIKPILDSLQESVDNNTAANQTVHINTNGTVWRDEFIDLFKKFKSVNLDISVDGINNQFEYLRHPAKFDEVVDNILKYKKLSEDHPQIQIAITVTVSIYNILDLEKILKFFTNMSLTCSFNLLHNPEYMNIRALPEDVKFTVKNHLLKKFNHPLKRPIMEFIELPLDTPDLVKEFITQTFQIDQQRNQSFEATFPEMYNLIRKYE